MAPKNAKPCKGARKQKHTLIKTNSFALTGLNLDDLLLATGLHPVLISSALSGL